ncbi:hypothetical protein LAX5112_02325 [Roseibium alexandrii]|uniref:Uncharacterized protein n=1 Tax=Roseibium alexandrii TaxID=388408 RepID=A0A0M7A4J2_9HYPH|nr:hypothetical protein LAX5112_02325 [Roseibium alexandrii]
MFFNKLWMFGTSPNMTPEEKMGFVSRLRPLIRAVILLFHQEFAGGKTSLLLG